MSLSKEELERYSRHIILKEIGYSGQKKLSGSSVLIIGAGGLGSPAALYLAAAGIGHIGIMDGDTVDRTNLQRQVIHTTPDLGRNKAESAAETMAAINPYIHVTAIPEFLTAENGRKLVSQYDFVLDGTDNFTAKYLINDACVLEKIPYVYGGILRFHGQIMTILPGQSPCYRCVHPEPPSPSVVPTCSQAGVVGAVAGVIGSLQALEAVKYLTGAGQLLSGRLLMVDALTMEMKTVELCDRDEECPVCSDSPTITELREENTELCGKGQ